MSHTLAQEFAAVVAQVKARNCPKRPVSAAPAPAAPLDVAAQRRELAALEAKHDPYYSRSDDYIVWSQGQYEASRIARLKRLLAA